MKATNLKRTIAALLAAAALCAAPTALAENIIKVFVDGAQLDFDVNPIMENDRTLVPMRAIFEALGAQVSWDGDTKTASAVKGGDTVKIIVDSNTLYKNGTAVELGVPARMVNDRTLVPVRAISESFEANVEWNGETKSVIITNPAPTAIPTAAPTAAPTAEPTVTPDTTQKPERGDKIQFTDEDIKALSDKKELLRYDFEQRALPQYVFENSKTMYATVSDSNEFIQAVMGLWTGRAVGLAINVGINSETTYTLDAAALNLDSLSPDDDSVYKLIDYFSDVTEKAGINAGSAIEAITCADNTKGTKIGVVILHEADSLVQCKYLGVVVSDNGEPRYFTAENDIMDEDNWYFCEVTQDGRGMLGTFPKQDAETDLNAFMNIAFKIYESGK